MRTSQKDAYEFIAELGERFPDLSDWEVCTAYEEYTGIPYLNPDSPIGRVVMMCYSNGIECASIYTISLYGHDWTKDEDYD